MASNYKELVDCPVCYDSMVNPKKLPCDHTFCAKCIENLKTGQKLKCPLDNKQFSISEIKVDFKHVQLLEFIKQFPTKSTKSNPAGCQMCEFCEENGGCFWCTTCETVACRTCCKAHKKTAKTHDVQSMTDVKRELLEKLKVTEDELVENEYALQSLESIETQRLQQYEDALDHKFAIYIQKLEKDLRKHKNMIRKKLASTGNEKRISSAKSALSCAKDNLDNLKQLINQDFKEASRYYGRFTDEMKSRIPSKISITNITFELKFVPTERLNDLVKIEETSENIYVKVLKLSPRHAPSTQSHTSPSSTSGSGGLKPQIPKDSKQKQVFSNEQQLYVGNLGVNITENHVRSWFSQYGKILHVNMHRDGRFCYVVFQSKKCVEKVLQSGSVALQKQTLHLERKGAGT